MMLVLQLGRLDLLQLLRQSGHDGDGPGRIEMAGRIWEEVKLRCGGNFW